MILRVTLRAYADVKVPPFGGGGTREKVREPVGRRPIDGWDPLDDSQETERHFKWNAQRLITWPTMNK